MSKLRERISGAMCLRGMAPRSQKSDLAGVEDLVRYDGRSPGVLGASEVRVPVVAGGSPTA